LTQDLLIVLLNFHLREISVIADIEKDFLQICLHTTARDLVCFLWLDDITRDPDDALIIVFRCTRPPFGVSSSPFLLNMVLDELLDMSIDVLFGLASKQIYVDNFVISLSTVTSAVERFECITE